MTEDTPLPFGDGPEPRRDFEKLLDLNRTKLTTDLVDQMEEALRRQQTAADDLKTICATASEREYSKREVAAMKQIARLRLKDQGGAAREKLEALERIGKAVGFDLFDWSGVRR